MTRFNCVVNDDYVHGNYANHPPLPSLHKTEYVPLLIKANEFEAKFKAEGYSDELAIEARGFLQSLPANLPIAFHLTQQVGGAVLKAFVRNNQQASPQELAAQKELLAFHLQTLIKEESFNLPVMALALQKMHPILTPAEEKAFAKGIRRSAEACLRVWGEDIAGISEKDIPLTIEVPKVRVTQEDVAANPRYAEFRLKEMSRPRSTPQQRAIAAKYALAEMDKIIRD